MIERWIAIAGAAEFGELTADQLSDLTGKEVKTVYWVEAAPTGFGYTYFTNAGRVTNKQITAAIHREFGIPKLDYILQVRNQQLFTFVKSMIYLLING